MQDPGRSSSKEAGDVIRFVSILMCAIAVGYFLAGCSSQVGVGRDSPSAVVETVAASESASSAPVTRKKDVLVFRAKYYQTTGPCIQLGDNALGMPIIDAFEVVEVLEGNFKANTINVHSMSEGGSSYPRNMAEGETYTLRLTPSEETPKQLHEKQNKEGDTFLWIDGDEIEEQQPTE